MICAFGLEQMAEKQEKEEVLRPHVKFFNEEINSSEKEAEENIDKKNYYQYHYKHHHRKHEYVS